MTDQVTKKLVQKLADICTQKNKIMTCAESCTGGLIAASCTDLAGSSAWFDRGFVTYSNLSKQQMLGVTSQTLDNWGAVSEQTVIEMAQGAVRNSQANMAVSVSGIAGPGGGSEEKPVGTVWFAWADDTGQLKTQCEHFEGDRAEVRSQAVITGLQGLVDISK